MYLYTSIVGNRFVVRNESDYLILAGKGNFLEYS